MNEPATCLGSGLAPEQEAELSAAKFAGGDDTGLDASPDFASARYVGSGPLNGAWTPASRPNDLAITKVIIHYTAGYHFPVIFGAGGGAHYGINTDGSADQYLLEKHIAWHAGNWEYNQHSVGIEHVGTGKPGDWTDALLRTSARLTATICKRHKIPMDRAHIIGHAEVPYPNDHTDPGANFPWAKYIALVKEYAGQKPVTPGASAPEYVYLAAQADSDKGIASALRSALTSRAGYKNTVFATGGDIAVQSKKVLALPGGKRPLLVIGGPTVAKLDRAAQDRRMYPLDAGSNIWDCVGASYAATVEEGAWRLADLCKRLRVDPGPVVAAYRAGLPDAPAPIKPTDPVAARVQKGIALVRTFIRAWYATWTEADGDTGSPIWSDRIPSRAEILKLGAVCSSVPNFFRLVNGLRPPIVAGFRGGTGAWGSIYGTGRFPYDPSKVYPAGTLFGIPYSGSTLSQQGHVAVSTTAGKPSEVRVIQADSVAGLNEDRTVAGTINALGERWTYAVQPGGPNGWLAA